MPKLYYGSRGGVYYRKKGRKMYVNRFGDNEKADFTPGQWNCIRPDDCSIVTHPYKKDVNPFDGILDMYSRGTYKDTIISIPLEEIEKQILEFDLEPIDKIKFQLAALNAYNIGKRLFELEREREYPELLFKPEDRIKRLKEKLDNDEIEESDYNELKDLYYLLSDFYKNMNERGNITVLQIGDIEYKDFISKIETLMPGYLILTGNRKIKDEIAKRQNIYGEKERKKIAERQKIEKSLKNTIIDNYNKNIGFDINETVQLDKYYSTSHSGEEVSRERVVEKLFRSRELWKEDGKEVHLPNGQNYRKKVESNFRFKSDINYMIYKLTGLNYDLSRYEQIENGFYIHSEEYLEQLEKQEERTFDEEELLEEYKNLGKEVFLKKYYVEPFCVRLKKMIEKPLWSQLKNFFMVENSKGKKIEILSSHPNEPNWGIITHKEIEDKLDIENYVKFYDYLFNNAYISKDFSKLELIYLYNVLRC